MSPPEVNILWYVPKSGDIPMVVDASNEHHYRLLANQTLMVFNLAKTDSGLYRCRANSKPTVESIASVNIQVDGKFGLLLVLWSLIFTIYTPQTSTCPMIVTTRPSSDSVRRLSRPATAAMNNIANSVVARASWRR